MGTYHHVYLSLAKWGTISQVGYQLCVISFIKIFNYFKQINTANNTAFGDKCILSETIYKTL